MEVIYYDIGLNLFGKQFPDPEGIIRKAEDAGVRCILTGTDMKENRQIDGFVREHRVYGTAGIHPHNADSARREDFEQLRDLLTSNGRIVELFQKGAVDGVKRAIVQRRNGNGGLRSGRLFYGRGFRFCAPPVCAPVSTVCLFPFFP